MSLRKFNLGIYRSESFLVWLFLTTLGGSLHEHAMQAPTPPAAGSIQGEMLIESFTPRNNVVSMVGSIQAERKQYRVKALYFTQSPDTISLKTGHHVTFTGKLKTIASPQNPYEFDGKAYATQQGIHAELFLDEFGLLATDQNNTLKTNSKEWLASQLALIQHEDVRSLLWAFTTGDKTKLDVSVKSSFGIAGIMHLLAVSGLHVGLIAGLPLFFLKRARKRWAQLLFYATTLLFCWSYAWLTGFQPSVIRASLMCTLLGLSFCFRVRSNSVNQLGAAALIMLVLEPTLLFTVGFQLSFAAVGGILIWSPCLQALFQLKHRFIKKVFNGLCVSFSAQAGSAPLSVYYFHQFPLLFLLANVIAIPLATLLLYTTLLFLVGQATGLTPSWFIWLIELEGELLLRWSHWVASFSWASADGLWLTAWEVIAFYVALHVLITPFIRKRSARTFRPAIMASVLVVGLICCRPVPAYEITLFSGKGLPHIGIRTDKEAYLYYTSRFGRYSTTGWRNRYGASEVELAEDTLVSAPENVWRKGSYIGIGPYIISPKNGHKKTALLDGINFFYDSESHVLHIATAEHQMDSLALMSEAGVFDLSSTGGLVSKHDLHNLPKREFHSTAE